MKNLIDNLKSNALEYWTLFMIVVGLPAIAFIFFGWAIALAVFVFVNIILGVLSLRKDAK